MRSRPAIALALAAAGAGACEAGTLRLASVLYYQGLAYASVGVSLFAFAVGAGIAARRKASFGTAPLLLGALAAWAGALTLPRTDVAWGLQLFALPMAAFGYGSAAALGAAADDAGRRVRYRAELLGATGGLALVAPLAIGLGGGAAAICAGGGLFALASAALLPAAAVPQRLALLLAAMVAFAVAPSSTLQLPATVGVARHLDRDVRETGAAVVATEHSLYARTDLVLEEGAPAARLYTDGMHVARAPAWDGMAPTFAAPSLEREVGLRRPLLRACGGGDVLILGAGGGLDVAVALQQGVRNVDAVEVNAAMPVLLAAAPARYSRALRDPRVRWHRDEGRRFAAAAQARGRRWGCVLLALVETAPASLRSNAPIDGRLLTVEALQTYRDLLDPGGALLVVHNDDTLLAATQATLSQALPAWHTATFRSRDATLSAANRAVVASERAEQIAAVAADLEDARRGERVDAGPAHGPVLADDAPTLRRGDGPLFPLQAWILLALVLALVRPGRASARAALLSGFGGGALQVCVLALGVAWTGLPAVAPAVLLAATLLGGAAAAARPLALWVLLALALALGVLAGPGAPVLGAWMMIAPLAVATAAGVGLALLLGVVAAQTLLLVLATESGPGATGRLLGQDGAGALLAALAAALLPWLGTSALAIAGALALAAAAWLALVRGPTTAEGAAARRSST
ncbi:MAG: hypothetical protein H6747_03060 [Deltaproteobacteria bacterium]|nr:hypothetical protein [Deltaproteobacteria bacterium]